MLNKNLSFVIMVMFIPCLFINCCPKIDGHNTDTVDIKCVTISVDVVDSNNNNMDSCYFVYYIKGDDTFKQKGPYLIPKDGMYPLHINETPFRGCIRIYNSYFCTDYTFENGIHKDSTIVFKLHKCE